MSVQVKGILMYGIYDSDKELELSDKQIEKLWNKEDLSYWGDEYCGEWQAIGIYIHATNEWDDKGPFKLDLNKDYPTEFEKLCKKHNIIIPEKFKSKVGIYHFLYYY